MSAWVFASDKPDQEQVEAVIRWARHPAESQIWALLDMALLDQAKFVALAKRNGLSLVSAYAHSDLAAFGDNAPQMLKLPNSEDARREVVRSLVSLAGNATALSWLQSNEAASSLQQVFAYLAKVRVEDRKMPIHCRFADTRVLPELLDVLLPEQQRQITSTIAAWCWINRQGNLRSWAGIRVELAAELEGELLHLSLEQFRTMQRAAEPDAIFMMLNQKTPELVPKTHLGALHGQICRVLCVADGYGVKTIKDRLQFVVLSLTCGEDFHTDAELQAMWRQILEQGASLSELMQGWSDALWQRLDARDGKIG